jgi:hypothetical protein
VGLSRTPRPLEAHDSGVVRTGARARKWVLSDTHLSLGVTRVSAGHVPVAGRLWDGLLPLRQGLVQDPGTLHMRF